MLFSILAGGDVRQIVLNLLLLIPVILLSLSIHEAAHGYIAYKMGDPTAYYLGRVTINPAKHLDPMGSLCMLVFGYGWAKPVPINARNFRDPKRGMAFTAIAGPISNLLVGVVATILFCLVNFAAIYFSGALWANEFLSNIIQAALTLLYYFGYMNFLLAVFNLIPIPPFDGSRFFSLFLPTKTYFALMKYERYIMLGLLVAIFACSRLFSFSPFGWVAEKLFGLVYRGVTTLLLLIFI